MQIEMQTIPKLTRVFFSFHFLNENSINPHSFKSIASQNDVRSTKYRKLNTFKGEHSKILFWGGGCKLLRNRRFACLHLEVIHKSNGVMLFRVLLAVQGFTFVYLWGIAKC